MAGGERTLLGVLLPGLTFLFLFGSVQGQTACRCDATAATNCKATVLTLLSGLDINCPNLITNLTCVYSSLAGCPESVATPLLTELYSFLSGADSCTGLPTFTKCAGTDPCAASACQNGASCLASADRTSYTCTCAPGFQGSRCETNKDDCAGSPCKNGGICSDGIASFSCACAAGFTGLTCETNINDCKADSCQNGGTCVDGVNSFSCTCPPFYTGQNCQTPHCDFTLLGQLFKNVSGTLIGAFNRSLQLSTCQSVEQSLVVMDTAWSACSSSPALSSTARLSVMRFTLRPYLQAFRSLRSDVCAGSAVVTVDSKCEVGEITNVFHAFFDMAVSGSLLDTCSAASFEKRRLMVALQSCSLRTRAALTLMTSELSFTAGAFCAPSGCNPDYVRLCLSEGNAALSVASATEDQLPEDTCRRVKLSLACSANHTVECGVADYMSVNASVKALRDTYLARCTQTPRPSCLQAPGQMLADVAQVLKSGVVLKEQVCKYQDKVRQVAMAAQTAQLSEEERHDLQQSAALVTQLLATVCAPDQERCTLLPDTGMCRGYFENFFYNATAGQCQQFIYGGCNGNDNRFPSLQECQTACGQPQVPVKKCDQQSFRECAATMTRNPCGALEDYKACIQQKVSQSGCTDADFATIFGGFNAMATVCGSEQRLQFADSNPRASALNRLVGCYSDVPKAVGQNSSDVCSNYDSLLTCLSGALDGLASGVQMHVQQSIDLLRRTLRSGFCSQVAGMSPSGCDPQSLNAAMACYNNYTKAMASREDAEKLCSRREEVAACLRPRGDCSTIMGLSRIFNSTVNSTCALYMAQHTQGCQPAKVSQCFELAAARDPDEECSASFDNAAVCAERESAGCPREFQERVSEVKRLLLRVGAGLCGQCPPEDRPEGCDPPEAVLCVLDIQHQAKCGTPDWGQICKSLDAANQCVERNIRTCAASEQRMVQDIVTRVNAQVRDTCALPPQERCESGEALVCVNKVKAVWNEGKGDQSSVCLAVAAARTCIVARTQHCDSRTRVALEVELRVLSGGFSFSCEQKELDVCIDAFRSRVSAILSYTPGAMEDKCTADKCDVGGDKNENEKEDKKEKDKDVTVYRPLETGLRALCADLSTAWTCMQSQLLQLPADRAQALNVTLASLWVLVRDACREAEPLTCYSCKNEDSNEDCNARSLEVCPWNKQMCQTDVHVNKDGSTKKVSKGCVPPPSCKSGCRGAKCSYCCDGHKCNHPLHGPISGTCDVKRAAVIVFNMAMQLVSTDRLNCTLLELELAALEKVRTTCRLAGYWSLLEVTEGLYVSSVVRQCKARVVAPNCGLHGVLSLATFLSHTVDREQVCKAVDTTVAAVEAIESVGQCSEAELLDLRTSFRLLTTRLADLGCPGTTRLWQSQPFKQVCEDTDPQVCRSVLTCNATAILASALDTLRQGEGDYCSRWQQVMAGLEGDRFAETGCPKEAMFYFSSLLVAMADVDTLTSDCNVSLPSDLRGSVSRSVAEFRVGLKRAVSGGSSAKLCQAAQSFGLKLLSAPYADLQTSCSLERLYMAKMGAIVEGLVASLCAIGSSEGGNTDPLPDTCSTALDAARDCLSDFAFDLPLLPVLPATQAMDKCRNLAELDRCVARARSSCPYNAASFLYSVYWRVSSMTQAMCGPLAQRQPHCDPAMAVNCFQPAATYRMSANVSREQLCSAVEEALNCSALYSQGCPEQDDLQMATQALALVKWGVLDYCPSLTSRLYCTQQPQSGSQDPSESAREAPTQTADCSFLALTPRITTCVGKFNPLTVLSPCGSLREVITCIRDVVKPCATEKDTLIGEIRSALDKIPTLLDALTSCSMDLSRDLFSATGDTPASQSCTAPLCNLTAARLCGLHSSEADLFTCVTSNITGCNSLQSVLALLALPKDSTLSVPPGTDFLALLAQFAGKLASDLRDAISAPQFQQWDFCVTLSQARDQLTSMVATPAGQVLQYLMVSQRAGLDHFLSTVCNDNATFSETYDSVEEEADKCEKSALTTTTTTLLVDSLFLGFLPVSDSAQLCHFAGMLERRVMSQTTCSLGLVNRLTLGVKATKAVLGRGCHTPEFCSLREATTCVAKLQLHVAQYSVNASRDDVCMALQFADSCVERHVSSCLSFLDEVRTFKTVYSWNRMLAVALCGGEELSALPAKCQAEVGEGDKDECTPADVYSCGSAGFQALVWPLSSQHMRCRAAAEARQCYVDKLCGNEAAAEAQLWPPLREDAMTCAAEQEVECAEGCSLHRAGLCLHVLYTATQPFSDRRQGNALCRAVSEARLCLLKESRTCPSGQRTLLNKKLTALLRTVPLGENDCQDSFSCLADFQAAAQEMFAAPVTDAKATDDEKDDKDKSNNGLALGKDKNDKDNNGLALGKDKKVEDNAEDPAPPAFTLPALCARARAAWLCLQTASAELPEVERLPLVSVLEGVWSAVQVRCEDTDQQSCYVCDGAKNEDECNEKKELCGYDQQMCRSQLWIEGGTPKFRKQCVRPDECVPCTGEGCERETFCCKGDLCNQQYSSVSDVQEPATCRVEKAMGCAVQYMSAYLQTGNIECSVAQQTTFCMERYTATCRSENLVAIATAAYASLRASVQASCTLTLEDDACGAPLVRAFTSKFSLTVDRDQICTDRRRLVASLSELQASGRCSRCQLLPLYQSLLVTEYLVQGQCRQDNDTCPSADVSSEITLQVQKPPSCSGRFLQAASGAVHALAALASPDTRAALCSSNTRQTITASLKNCRLPASLHRLTSQLTARYTEVCSVSKPSCNDVVCDVTSAVACANVISTSSVSDGAAVCRSVESAEACFTQKTSSCLSLQQPSARQLFVEQASSLLENSTTTCQVKTDVELHEDPFKALAKCLSSFTSELQAAVMSDSYREEVCLARRRALQCRRALTLPALVKTYLLAQLDSFTDLIASVQEYCDDQTTRSARQAPTETCDLQQVSSCLSLHTALSLAIAGADIQDSHKGNDRNSYCRMRDAKERCVRREVEGCSDGRRKLVLMLLESSVKSASQFCDPLDYEEPSCEAGRVEKQVAECMERVSSLNLFGRTPQNLLCEAAADALKCAERFTEPCDGGVRNPLLASTRLALAAMVGSECPQATLDLFCSDRDVQGAKLACQTDRGLQCLRQVDLSPSRHLLPSFCSDLARNLTCISSSAQGCTLQRLQVVRSQMTSVRAGILSSSCSVTVSTFNLDNVCVAPPTCSLTKALQCMDAQLLAGSPNCSVAVGVYECIQANLSGCEDLEETAVLGLFRVLFHNVALPACDARFGVSVASGVQSCIASFFSNLYSRPLCRSVSAFVQCVVTVSSSDAKPLALVAAKAAGRLQKLLKLDDCEDPDLPDFQAATTCHYREMMFCIAKQSAFTIMGSFLTQNDKQAFCSLTQQQAIQDCVQSRLFQCNSRQQSYFQLARTRSSALLQSAGACSAPSLCDVTSVRQCLTRMEEAAVTFSSNSDKTSLCTVLRETKECVSHFTATCDLQEQIRIKAELTTVTSAHEVTCADVVPPPEPVPPVCASLQVDRRQCNLINALGCFFDYHDKQDLQSVVWRDECTKLQNIVRCVAFNTSGCQGSDWEGVHRRVAALQTSMRTRCPWLTSDLCTDESACPVENSNCLTSLKDRLTSHAAGPFCSWYEEARSCIERETASCSDFQRRSATEKLALAMQGLALPVRCVPGSLDDTLLLFSVQAKAALKTGGQAACNKSLELMGALRGTGVATALLTAPELKSVLSVLFTILSNRLVACPAPVASSCSGAAEDLLVDVLVKIALTNDFSKDSFCSMWDGLVAAAGKNCGGSPSWMQVTLTGLAPNVSALCAPEAVTACSARVDKARTAVQNLGTAPTCRAVQEAASYITGQLSGCAMDDVRSVFASLQSVLPASCVAFHPVLFSATLLRPLTVTEGQSDLDLNIVLIAEPEDDVIVRLSFAVSDDLTAPKCMASERERAMPQVAVGAGDCRARLRKDNWKGGVLVPIRARLDGTRDGDQTVDVTVTATEHRVNGSGVEGDALVSYVAARFRLLVKDRDLKVPAKCSSINDPHIKTFNNIAYNNMLEGRFVLYQRRSTPNLMVAATYQQCAESGTCNCRVEVLMHNALVTFDRCRRADAARDFTAATPPLDVSLHAQGTVPWLQRHDAQIWRDADINTYSVLMPDGTLVRVKNGDNYLNVWVTPSVLALQDTEGLCGMCDDDAYNDLQLPNGSRYQIQDDDRIGLILAPNDYSRAWRLSQDPIRLGTAPPASDVTFCTCSAQGTSSCGGPQVLLDGCLLRGEDITDSLLSQLQQEGASEGLRRKRRQAAQAPVDVNENTVHQMPTWPTRTGWTEQNATEYCEYHVARSFIMQKCSEAVDLAGDLSDKHEQAVQNCKQDILLSGGTAFLSAALDEATESCLSQVLQDLAYQRNNTVASVVRQIFDLTCPLACSGHGTCNKGVCDCEAGYIGTGCEVTMAGARTPEVRELLNQGLCEMTAESSCRSVFVLGSNFVLSTYLSCHLEVMEIDSRGVRSTGVSVKVPATLITPSQLKCPLERVQVSGSRFAVRVSVSNDGQSPSAPQLFVAFDPTCHQCDLSSGRCDRMAAPVCEIEGRCFSAGHVSAEDHCLFCSPAVSASAWTRNSTAACRGVGVEPEKKPGPEPLSSLFITIIACVCALCVVVIVAILARVCITRIRSKRTRRRSVELEGRFDNPTYSGSQHALSKADQANAPPEYSHGDPFAQNPIRPRYNSAVN